MSQPKQTTHVLATWVHTSSVHAYPVIQFRGTAAECETQQAKANFPQRLAIYPVNNVPSAY